MVGATRHSLTAAVTGHLAGAVLLVALAAIAFQAVGSLGDTDLLAGGSGDDPAAGSDDPDDAEPDDGSSATGGTQEGEAEQPDTDGPDADDPDDADEAKDDEDEPASDGAAGADDEDEPGSDGAGEDQEAEPDDEGSEEAGDAAASIDPGEISVQVLDGYQQDGGAAADAVAEQLTAAGYDVVAQNPALRYEVTTVLWTSGNQDAARQVAAEIDAAEVEAQPGTLSEEVAVHVVVGADRG